MQCINNLERLTMSHIAELQWRLTKTRNEIQENRANLYSSGNGNGNYNSSSTNYRSRTASTTREEQDPRERRKQMIQRGNTTVR